jgi:FAD/FMN-containing dehydrogenase
MEIREFRASLRGSLQQPGDAGYDAARRVWNGAIDRKPALIARCAGPADVLGAVNFARTNQLLVSVRGGGHNVTGNAVCDGGLMIDLSPMKGIRVDRQRRTVTAQAGVTWGDLDHETQAFGLATTGGQISTTGIAGLTLGGGLGWLMRKCGLVVDNLLSADVVTADGRFLTASPTENADLFWGLRGGGGNLGLVTSFEYRLHPIGPIVTGGVILHPAERAADALRFYREHMAKAGDDEMVVFAFQSAPPAPFVPAHLHGAPVVALALCHVGSLEEGQRAVERLRAFGQPLVVEMGPMPYTAVQKMMDEAMPFGRHVYLRSDHLRGLDDDVIKACVQQTATMTSPLSVAVIVPLGGAVARVGEHDTAFSHRSTPFDIDIFGIWTDPRESDRHLAWGRAFGAALQPFSRGVYINEMGSEGDERIRAAYHPANYARLVTLKNQYDPTNFWRMNQNIKPTV